MLPWKNTHTDTSQAQNQKRQKGIKGKQLGYRMAQGREQGSSTDDPWSKRIRQTSKDKEI